LSVRDKFLSNVVDIFNVTAGTWTTAALSEAREGLAATSLPNAGLAIFAGGQSTLIFVFGLKEGAGHEILLGGLP
jgi:hypothetical protein